MYMGLESAVETAKKPVYLTMVISLYFAYAAAFLGLIYINPKYIEYLSLAIHTFVCLFLIYKFHPFRQHKLEPFDSNIIFASAGLLLANTGLSEYVASTLRTNELIKSTFAPLSDINITHI